MSARSATSAFSPARTTVSRSTILAAAVAGVSVGVVSQAFAAGETYTFTPVTGTQSWSNNASWTSTPGDFPNEATDIANVTSALTGNLTLNLNGAITVGVVNLADTNGGAQTLALANGTGGSLLLNNSPGTAQIGITNASTGTGLFTVSATTTLGSNLSIFNDSGALQQLTYSGGINGAASGYDITLDAAASRQINLTGALTGGDLANPIVLTKNGAGRVDVNNASSNFVGSVTLNTGTLRATGSTAFGNSANVVTVNGGVLSNSFGTLGYGLTLAGGTIGSDGGNRTYSGNINVTAASFIDGRDTLGANNARTTTLSGILSGSADLTLSSTFTSAGQVTLTNDANDYSGNITLGNQTNLQSQAADGSGSALGSAKISFASGRTLNIRDNGDGTTNPETLVYNNNIETLTGAGSATISIDRASGTGTSKTVQLGGTLDIASGTALQLSLGNSYRYDLSGTINNSGTLRTNSNGNYAITNDYFGLAGSRLTIVANGVGSLDGAAVTNEARISNGDAYDTGTGRNVLRNLTFTGSGNLTVAGSGTSVLITDQLFFDNANGQPWIVVRDGASFTFGATQTLAYTGSNNRATRIGGNGVNNSVIFQNSYGNFLGSNTSVAQIGLVTLETQAAVNSSQSGFNFQRSGAIWKMTTNNQTFAGGQIDVLSGVAITGEVASGISAAFTGDGLELANGATFTKAGTGSLDLNNSLVLGTAATLGLTDGNVSNYTITSGEVLSANWDTITNAPTRNANGVVLSDGAIVAHANGNSTSTMAGLGTSGDLFLGLATDFNRSATVGSGTTWKGISTDAAANRTWQSGTINLAGGDVKLQGINGRTLTIGGTTAFAGAAAGTNLVINGNVAFDVNNIDLSAVNDISVQGGTLSLAQPFTGLGGDLVLFYGSLNAQGASDAATAVNGGVVDYRGFNTLSATKGVDGNATADESITFTLGGLNRVNRGVLNIAATDLGSSEKVIVSGQSATALLPTYLINGNNFVAYDATNGVVPATHTITSVDASSSSEIVDVTANDAMSASKQIRALRIGAFTLDTAGNTLTLGDATPGTAGIIATGNGSITGGTLDVGGREITAQVAASSTLDISSAITNGSGGLTKFGAGTLNLNGDNSGLNNTVTVSQGTLSLASAPAAGTNFRMGPATTLGLKADVDTAFGGFEIDEVPNSTVNVNIGQVSSGNNVTLAFTGNTNVVAGNVLNINATNGYNLGVNNLTLAAGSTVNVASANDGAALIVSGAYSDTDNTLIQTQRYSNGRNSGLVLAGPGSATVNAIITTNGDSGQQQLTAVQRQVTFSGTIGHQNAEKTLGAYDGGTITLSPTATLDTYDGNNWRSTRITGNGMTVAGAGSKVVYDAAFNTATQGDNGAFEIGNLAVLETRSNTNYNQAPVAGSFVAKSGAQSGTWLSGKWLVTTNDQTYAGNVRALGNGDGNLTSSNATIDTVTNFTVNGTVEIGRPYSSGSPNIDAAAAKLEKLGAGTLTLTGSQRFHATTTGSSTAFSTPSQLIVSEGTLAYNMAPSTATRVDPGSLAQVGSGATLSINATNNNPFEDDTTPTQRVAVTNNGSFNVTAGSVAVASLDGTGTTNVTAGTLTSVGGIRQGTLSISNNALVTVPQSNPAPQGNDGVTSLINTLAIANDGAPLDPSAFRAYSGTLDLANNDLVIRGGSIAEIQDMVRAGRVELGGSGKGITSSESQVGLYAGVTTLGVIQNDDGFGNPIYTDWNGFTGLTTTDILLKYTWYGDADLSGLVDDFDFALLDAGFTGGGSGWFYGDFDLNGAVDDFDFALLDAGFSGGGANAHLPEPASLSVIAVVAAGLLRRRRRMA